MTTTQQADKTFGQNIRDAGDGVDRIKNDMKKNLRDESTGSHQSGASEIRQGMHDAVEAGKETYEGAKEMVREGYEGTKKAAQDATTSLRHVVADNPFASIGIAAGAGLLLGSILIWRLRS